LAEARNITNRKKLSSIYGIREAPPLFCILHNATAIQKGRLVMKRKICIRLAVLAVCLEFTLAAVPAAAAVQTPALSIQLDGKTVPTDADPFIDDKGRTMVPVRFISEALGAEVGWNGNTGTVTITKGGAVIKLTIGSPQIIINGKAAAMDTAAVIKDSRTFVPVRYIAEALGLSVGWDGPTRTVILTGGSPTPVNTDADYTGLWHASPVVGSGYSERLALNADRTFLWAASQMDGQERTRFRSGVWTADGGRLKLTTNEEIRWEGGREVPAYASWGTDTVIEDARNVLVKLTESAEYKISPITVDTEVLGKRTVTIGGVQYWEMAGPIDLETMYEDYTASKKLTAG